MWQTVEHATSDIVQSHEFLFGYADFLLSYADCFNSFMQTVLLLACDNLFSSDSSDMGRNDRLNHYNHIKHHALNRSYIQV